MPLIPKDDIIHGVGLETGWMIEQRMAKLREALYGTMAINPLLIPILFELHHADSFSELGELLLAGHLMSGHFTSFGKLMDEKILPKVFKTTKLSGSFRAKNEPFVEACFNEIDHLVPREAGAPVLLSLKSSRWTIQLTMAMEMNNAFNTILTRHPQFDQIVVGVLYGTQEGLTDKYDILRGINRGKVHDVVNITDHVHVVAGRQFWSWLNGDEPATQDWVLAGILDGLRAVNCREECRELLTSYRKAFNEKYAGHVNEDGTVSWQQLLTDING